MRKQYLTITMLIFLLVLFVLAFITRAFDAEANNTPHQTDDVCDGFVVLPNGYAVQGRLSSTHAHAMEHAHHGSMHEEKAMSHEMGDKMMPKHEMLPNHEPIMQNTHSHEGDMIESSAAHQQMMGYQHGQEIHLQKGMLCVPIGSKDETAWTAVSHTPSLYVRAESLSGLLTHNSRANESIALTVMQRDGGIPDERTQVRLLARMPHHDRNMPGGHGLANDPDVKGLAAQPDTTGRYLVQSLDFSMAGAWLIEVQVQHGNTLHRAYFAVDVGEE